MHHASPRRWAAAMACFVSVVAVSELTGRSPGVDAAFLAPPCSRAAWRARRDAGHQQPGVRRRGSTYRCTPKLKAMSAMVAMCRRVGPSIMLDALLDRLHHHGSGSGRTKGRWDGETYGDYDAILDLFECSHIDPFAPRQDYFKRELPRDIARFGDFRTAMLQKPYAFLLGHKSVTPMDELYLGDNTYARRFRIDRRPFVFTFRLTRRFERWGVDYVLAEDEEVEAEV